MHLKHFSHGASVIILTYQYLGRLHLTETIQSPYKTASCGVRSRSTLFTNDARHKWVKLGFFKNPSFKIAMSGRAGVGRVGRRRSSSQVYILVNIFFKVTCYASRAIDTTLTFFIMYLSHLKPKSFKAITLILFEII